MPGTAFWLVHNWPLGLRGSYITSGYEFMGYTFFSLMDNFSAYCNPVLRGSMLLPPPARMARWQRIPFVFFIMRAALFLSQTISAEYQMLFKVGSYLLPFKITTVPWRIQRWWAKLCGPQSYSQWSWPSSDLHLPSLPSKYGTLPEVTFLWLIRLCV